VTKDASDLRAHLDSAVAAIRSRTAYQPEVAIILGTGLGALAKEIRVETSVPYADIPHFPLSTVETHSGQLLFGTLGGKRVVAMQGRFHRYEGYSLQQIVLPVRAIFLLGAKTLIVSNACGGMNPLWRAGDIMLIDDHINLLGDNPLVGPNLDDLGPRFPDMSDAYDRHLQTLAEEAALDLKLPLRRGVYVAVSGPNLETRAEYRMLRTLGADVVGMSTVPEVIAARHMGMRVLGLSIVTDECLPDALEAVDIQRIIATAAKAEPNLTRLVVKVLEKLLGQQPLT
jgi:purine-nucleoside phosphorylase